MEHRAEPYKLLASLAALMHILYRRVGAESRGGLGYCITCSFSVVNFRVLISFVSFLGETRGGGAGLAGSYLTPMRHFAGRLHGLCSPFLPGDEETKK